MPENTATTPPEQATAPPEQAPAAPETTPPSVDWKARYDGQVRKTEELTLTKRDLTAELATKTSEIEQLNAQLGIKDTEKTVAVGERDKQLQEILTAKTQLESEVTGLRALELKVQIAQELDAPELLKIQQHIPNLTDKETLTAVMKDFKGFSQEAVKAREQQLLSGVLPVTGSVNQEPQTPATQEAWVKHYNSLPIGSPEREKAIKDMGVWLENEHKT